MVLKSYLGIFNLFTVISLSYGFGEFFIVSSPPYVKFLSDAGKVDTSDIPGTILSLFGLPLDQDLKWRGLEELNVFKRPKAVVVVSVSSVPHGGLQLSYKSKYSTVESDAELDTELIVHKIGSLNWKHPTVSVEFATENFLVNVKTTYPALFDKLGTTVDRLKEDLMSNAAWIQSVDVGSLNISREADSVIITELFAVEEIVKLLQTSTDLLKKNSPDFFHFKLNGLHDLQVAYGKNSKEMRDAVKLIEFIVNRISNEFDKLYSNNAVVEVIGFTNHAGQEALRKGRQLRSTAENNSTLNLAPAYTDMYPVVFNIVLWLMIAFALALFGISWGIWNMDPGRDSVIYRMTSQRVKRD